MPASFRCFLSISVRSENGVVVYIKFGIEMVVKPGFRESDEEIFVIQMIFNKWYF